MFPKKLFLTIVVAALFFTACNDNVNNGDTAPQSVTIIAESVAGATPDLVTVKGIYYNGSEDVIFGTAPFTPGGGFSMLLPAALSGDGMATLTPYYESVGEVPAGIKISDLSAKFVPIYFRGYDADGVEIGFLLNQDTYDPSVPEIFYWYLDRSVTITGSDFTDPQHIYKYNLRLRNGWNKILYIVANNTETYASPVPEGTEVGWFFRSVSD